ncbi:MAG TPA: hypothetical protein VE109_00210, partial [Acidobacteriaceae bacterium]|nr:hypothetical protein [Acidobacteriaceae bacterium]
MFHRTHERDAMLFATLKNQMAPDIGAIHQLTLRQEPPFGKLALSTGDVRRVGLIRRGGINVCDET